MLVVPVKVLRPSSEAVPVADVEPARKERFPYAMLELMMTSPSEATCKIFVPVPLNENGDV